MNGSGTRDTGTVTSVLKKLKIPHKCDGSTDIIIQNALVTEMDEMWSFYKKKSNQIWLWLVVDHAANTPLAYVFGTREHKYLFVKTL
jgi:hypothetical protein